MSKLTASQPAEPRSTLLLDLDGVIRHFDADHVGQVEDQYGLDRGLLIATAFAPHLLQPAITGAVTRAQWQQQIGEAVGSPAAARDWMAERGEIDDEVILIAERVRAAGFVVAVLTNGTDTVHDEMLHFGIHDRFDAVFSTWEIGYAKPDPRAFQAVCSQLEVSPGSVFFTDDSPSKLTGAAEIGMTARPFLGVEKLESDILELFGEI